MKIQRITVGPLQSNCYVVYDEQALEALVIDPGDDARLILQSIDSKKLKILYIVCTHAHFDHIGAVAEIREKTGGKIVLHKNEIEIYEGARDQGALWGFVIEQPPQPDILIDEGDELSVGDITLKVLHTPGHSPGGISLYCEGVVLTGDTVFAGSVGRTDFYGGSIEELKMSFKRIISLPPETQIFPGHGDLSTVKNEKEFNFFIQELML
jgi:glyoxylase-like metal-dependent hydrolase (beta-lactamase superfamily II)